MIEEKYPETLFNAGDEQVHRSSVRRASRSRVLLTMLLAAAITILLTCSEVAMLWIFRLHLPGGGVLRHFSDLHAMLTSAPLVFLVPFVEFAAVFLIVLTTTKSLSLLAYLRTLRAMAGPYIPLVEPEQHLHQLIVAAPGAGRTTMLRLYQHTISQQIWAILRGRERIPVYIPLLNYSLYLKMRKQEEVTLLDFLYESDLPHLRPYLERLLRQGRLLLLCDGLDEVEGVFLAAVCAELDYLMRATKNRVLLTSREREYREQPRLQQLVGEGLLAYTEIPPLEYEQIREFVERYISAQETQTRWQHTAGQIMEVIDHSRLRYLCTTPMMLSALMEVIDTLGVQRARQVDTRGRLLREYVSQLLDRAGKRSRETRAKSAVITLLSEIAYTARLPNEREAIRQPLLRLALDAGLLAVGPEGVLSFCHELVAAYCVAEYLASVGGVVNHASTEQAALPLSEELLADIPRWSEPVMLWAGLLDDPSVLAERLVAQAKSDPAHLLELLTLSLLCMGVLWLPPQAGKPQHDILPPTIEKALAEVLRDVNARKQLAHVFTRCAAEGGPEAYRSLLLLLHVEDIDTFLTLLDETVVPDLLFNYLAAIVDDAGYDTQVRRLISVLGRMSAMVLPHAAGLSQSGPARSLRLRVAAIIILGGTGEPGAVEPLIARLGDVEQHIRTRAARALMRLGPELTLERVISELENRAATSFTREIHAAALTILEHFLNEQGAGRGVTTEQRRRMLEAIVAVLGFNYAPDTQEQARQLLVKQGDSSSSDGAQAVEVLVQALSSGSETLVRNVVRTLQEIGPAATPMLLAQLEEHPSEAVRVHIVEVFAGEPQLDLQALPSILRLVADPSLPVQQQVEGALRRYMPASIPGLIELVLYDESEATATRAARILGEIGAEVVDPIISALPEIVPGRTRLLVYVLERVHDARAVPGLIALLETPNIESLLAVAVVHTLGQFADRRVVLPLLHMLAHPNAQLHEEAVNALGQLGEVAVDDLLAALDVEQETAATERARRALLGMDPFPGERLIEALEGSSEAQALQIVEVLLANGSEAARLLVAHLTHHDARVQGYVREAFGRMEGHVAVPALVEVLHYPALRPAVDELLHTYPQEAIPQLVGVLDDAERGDAAAEVLLKIGPVILPVLMSGLDDAGLDAQERTQQIIAGLVRQEPGELPQAVQLFALPLSEQAREVLLEVLVNDLVDVCIPLLLEGLESVRLIDGVSEALVRIAQRTDAYSDAALSGLFQALREKERRDSARIVLVNIGAAAVPGIIHLLTDADYTVVQAAQQVLRNIGVAAFPFIWAACSDVGDPARREVALKTFYSMPTAEIKDGLIEHLVGDEPRDITMALGLLLERIYGEASLPRVDQEMIRALLEHVQTQGEERVTQRILALLLLVGGSDMANQIAWGLYHYHDHPAHQERLARTFLLLGKEAEAVLLEMLRYRPMSTELLAEILGVLGMLSPRPEVFDYVRAIGVPDTASYQTGSPSFERHTIALHALGGLLAGGHLNNAALQKRLASSLYGSAEHELYSVLLGKPYGPQLIKLEEELRSLRYEYEKDRRDMMIRLGLLEKEKEELEGQFQELEERNWQLESANRRMEQGLRKQSGA